MNVLNERLLLPFYFINHTLLIDMTILHSFNLFGAHSFLQCVVGIFSFYITLL